MSRHRDVRAMKYSDEYDGYDDVYGHSVEDDYAVSPGAEQFMFDRNKQQNMASFFTEPDIKEDEEEEDEACLTPKKPELSEIDTARLISCIEVIRNVIGDSVTEAELTGKIIKADFNAEVALDEILKATPQKTDLPAAMVKDRPDSQTGSSGSSLSFTNPLAPRPKFPQMSTKKSPFKNPFSAKNPDSSPKPPPNPDAKFTSLSALIANHEAEKPDKKPFSTLADLTKNHLQNSGSSGKTSFFIPKFSLKSSNPGISPINVKLEADKRRSTEQSVQTLSKKLEFTGISSKISLTKEKIGSENVDLADSLEVQTHSGLLIDLTTVLRQTSVLSLTDKKAPELNKFDLKDIYMMTSEPLPTSMIVESLDNLKKCDINLSSLQFTALPYVNNAASRLGKMLCRKWRPRRPYIKSQPKDFGQLKAFDFTSPSPDSLILANLRRQ